MSDKSELKFVPKLRFQEFRGAGPWKPIPLGEASSPVTERVGERKLTPVSISAGIGFVPQTILSHGNYSLDEPQEMLEENKNYFRRILHEFITRYPFNPALFPSAPKLAAGATL